MSLCAHGCSRPRWKLSKVQSSVWNTLTSQWMQGASKEYRRSETRGWWIHMYSLRRVRSWKLTIKRGFVVDIWKKKSQTPTPLYELTWTRLEHKKKKERKAKSLQERTKQIRLLVFLQSHTMCLIIYGLQSWQLCTIVGTVLWQWEALDMNLAYVSWRCAWSTGEKRSVKIYWETNGNVKLNNYI